MSARLGCILVLLGGCSRVGFGDTASGSADGMTPDAPRRVEASSDSRRDSWARDLPLDAVRPRREVDSSDLAVTDVGQDLGPLGAWVIESLPGASSDHMHDLWVTPSEVFVVGASGKVYQKVGTTWNNIGPSISADLHAIQGLPGSGVVVAGYNSQIWLRGVFWSSISFPSPGVQLIGASGLAPTDLWVISSTAIWRGTAQGFGVVSGCPGVTYAAIHGSSATDVWLAGAAGAICHYDGSSFSKIANNVSGADLLAVWAAPSVTWFAGSGGTILRLGANGLVPMSSGTTAPLHGIWGASANDLWAVGEQGTIVHFDGQSWSKVFSPTSQNLWAVRGSSASRVYAVGNKNTAIRLQP